MSHPRTTTSPHPGILISASGVQWQRPSGEPLWPAPLDFTIGNGITALVGRNGAGKSLLTTMLTGECAPSAGRIHRQVRIARLPQQLHIDAGSLADVAGLAEINAAMMRIAAGNAEPEDFETMDGHWDIEPRWSAMLADAGLPRWPLSHPANVLSGGQLQRVALAGVLLSGAGLLVLDEPSNHLDTAARSWLADALRAWKGGALLISHDRALLALVSQVIELDEGVRAYGGSFADYQAQRAIEHQAAAHAADHARKQLRRSQREMHERHDAEQRRHARGSRDAAQANLAPILLGRRKEGAQNSDGARSKQRQQIIDKAQQDYRDACAGLPDAAPVTLLLPQSVIAEGRRVLSVRDIVLAHFSPQPGFDLDIIGPRRVALRGSNGSGKSSLLDAINEPAQLAQGVINCPVTVAKLDQTCRGEIRNHSVLDVLAAADTPLPAGELRSHLALLGLDAGHCQRPLASLCGGEQLKAQLALALWGGEPAGLLLLDEPGNHLDLHALEAFEAALSQFGGALIIASHDEHLLEALGCDQHWRMGDGQVSVE